jgi:hypothetical protein
MNDLSPKRKRTLALHDRALRFSNAVNISCPNSFSNLPSRRLWDQLVRAADGSSNNLIEADDASSDADFQLVGDRGLESEAGQLAAIYAAIIRNMRIRLERETEERKKQPARRN